MAPRPRALVVPALVVPALVVPALVLPKAAHSAARPLAQALPLERPMAPPPTRVHPKAHQAGRPPVVACH